MAVITGILIVLALFALGILAHLSLGARGMRWTFGWKSWLALGVASGLLLAGRWGGALVLAAVGLYLAQPRLAQQRRAPSTGGAEAPEAAAARALLAVSRGATQATIRAAYRDKMASMHPDAGGTHEAAQALTRARDLLLGQKN